MTIAIFGSSFLFGDPLSCDRIFKFKQEVVVKAKTDLMISRKNLKRCRKAKILFFFGKSAQALMISLV